ncbi:hypothetical protein BYT27DRAFT_7247893 [Phlegmacium glaucopus]|nr:hypothetical protein BYT27DRAFT_7247893 [Phlegmacium glaucopus]
MHCRNPYSNPPDLSALAAEYQPLKYFLILDTSSRHRIPKSNFEFTMCNPPFYTSSEEPLVNSNSIQSRYVREDDIEMIFAEGGEEGFVGQMVEESEHFQTRCKWYTSMLGKMSSVTTIVENLRERSIVNYAITEFVQGQTHHWAVGWSFIDMHLPDGSVARLPSIVAGHPPYQLMPPHNTLTQSFLNCSVPMSADILDRNLRPLEGVSATNRDPGLLLILLPQPPVFFPRSKQQRKSEGSFGN